MSEQPIVSIEKRESGRVATLRCRGMDFEASQALKNAVDRSEAEAPCKRWVIDMSTVEFVPSVGIGMLVKLLNASKAQSGEFVLVGVNSKIREHFRISAIEQLFDFRDDMTRAFD